MDNRQREFCKLLDDHNHSESSRAVFDRWVEMAYCALSKPMDAAPDVREARYMALAARLKPGRAQQFAEMLGLMTIGMEESGGKDFLGPIVSEREFLNSYAGQFFTPPDLSELMARMILSDALATIEQQGILRIGEPAAGAGTMLLAAARVLKEQGINVTRDVWFDATDVAGLCQQMCFVQMSIAGLAGVVRCQNSLTLEPAYDVATLPMSMIFYARHGSPWKECHNNRIVMPEPEDPIAAEAEHQIQQLVLL